MDLFSDLRFVPNTPSTSRNGSILSHHESANTDRQTPRNSDGGHGRYDRGSRTSKTDGFPPNDDDGFQPNDDDGRKWKGKKPLFGYRRLKDLIEKEPHEIISVVLNPKSRFLDMIEDEDLRNKPDWLMLVFRIVAKVCISEMFHSKGELLSCLCDTSLLKHLNDYLSDVAFETRPNTLSNVPIFVQDVVTFCKYVVNGIPKTACDKNFVTLISKLKVSISNVKEHANVTVDSNCIEVLDTTLSQLNNANRHSIKTANFNKRTNDDYMRALSNCPPPDNFREISLYPTLDDLHEERGFIRPNLTKGAYRDTDHYLDVQFRLLREDFIGPLRQGVRKFIDEKKVRAPKSKFKYENVHFYIDVQFVGKYVGENKVGYAVLFDPSKKISSRINWESSKRFMFGSLLLFTRNDFRDFFLATVLDGSYKNLRKGVVIVRIVGDAQLSGPASSAKYVMAESEVYFEPYFLIMKSLKTVHAFNFPMNEYIVDAFTTTDTPVYIRRNPFWELNFHSHDITELYSWPSADALGLDEFQCNAFQSALTRDFVVIQGPPGTGKTFLGLKIVRTMLENRATMLVESPILLVSYTNHALDQFLEGILQWTKRIVRIGGQSKSDILELYNLRSRRRSRRSSRSWHHVDAAEMLNFICNHIRTWINTLKRTLRQCEYLQNRLGVVSFKLLMSVVHRKHKYAFENDDEFLSWLIDDAPEMNDNFTDPAKDAVDEEDETDITDDTKDNIYYKTDEFETYDLYDKDDMYNTTAADFPTSSCVRDDDFAYKLLGKKRAVAVLRLEAANAKILLDKGNVSYADYHNRCCRIDYDIKKHERLYKFVKTKLNSPEVRSSTVTDADLKNLKCLPVESRWLLYGYWANRLSDHLLNKFKADEASYRKEIKMYEEYQQMEDIEILRNAEVVGITTSGAARLKVLLNILKPKIVIIEEAAEVLEAHIVVSLTEYCEHVILIGDHKQLKPSPAVYELSKRFHFDLSLFERMVNNGMDCPRLKVQHRMRAEISDLICPLIYTDLQNHPDVYGYPDVSGVKKNVYFITHRETEQEETWSMSKTNIHEAKFMIALCRYLLLQGYSPEKITILTTYTGQMFELQKAKKENGELKDVRMVVVDKYQGEENDIVLLSLVRSNKENNIGFLSVENRVCVALSRARHGLYIIGNMEQLSSVSEMWKQIQETLIKQNAIGEHLTLVCQIHDIETNVSTKDDFNKVSQGGCSTNCGTLLQCGHNCKSMCHIVDRNHETYRCHEPCPKSCLLNHPCKRRCYEECGDCLTFVPKTLECGHSLQILCYENPEMYKCDVRINVVLPNCEHETTKQCFEDIAEVRCPHMCQDRLDCGHACQRTCHKTDDPDHEVYKCRKPCARQNKRCKFEHMCKKLCFEECGDCVVITEQKLLCGHSFNLLCSVRLADIKCFKPCERVLECGHGCKKRCHEPCEPCNSKVKKKIPECGHDIIIECWRTPDRSLCARQCERLRTCGHPCKDECCNPCDNNEKCMELVLYDMTLICGHNKSYIYCHQQSQKFEIEELMQLCQEKCNATLSCKHVCSGTCGDCWQGKLHTNCMQKCENVLICGHSCDHPCYKLCSPCMKSCNYRCVHSRCPEICGVPCVKCREPCAWKCEHLQCKRLCGDICDREPCYEACKKLLNCGHPCIGFCGEPCPPLCRICNKEEVTTVFLGYEDKEDSRFVYLVDCKHTIESRGLEQSLKISPEDGEITMKRCPLCKTPIMQTLRYMKYVKETYVDISRVDRKIFEDVNQLEAALEDITKKLITVEPIMNCLIQIELVAKRFLASVPSNTILPGDVNQLKTAHEDITKKLMIVKPNMSDLIQIGNKEIKSFYIFLLTNLKQDRNGRFKISYAEMCSVIFLGELFVRLIVGLKNCRIEKLPANRKSSLLISAIRLLKTARNKTIALKKEEVEFMYRQINKVVISATFYALENSPNYRRLREISNSIYEEVNDVCRTLSKPTPDFEDAVYDRLSDILKRAMVAADTHITIADKAAVSKVLEKEFHRGTGRAGHWFHCSKCRDIYCVVDCGQFNQTGHCPTCKNVIGSGSARIAVSDAFWNTNS